MNIAQQQRETYNHPPAVRALFECLALLRTRAPCGASGAVTRPCAQCDVARFRSLIDINNSEPSTSTMGRTLQLVGTVHGVMCLISPIAMYVVFVHMADVISCTAPTGAIAIRCSPRTLPISRLPLSIPAWSVSLCPHHPLTLTYVRSSIPNVVTDVMCVVQRGTIFHA